MKKIEVIKIEGFKKVTGLLGKKQPENLYFRTRFGIHTFGMKFPIDVVILDKKNAIVDLKCGLCPNRIFLWNPRYDKVLELPNGFIVSSKIKIGSTIELFISV